MKQQYIYAVIDPTWGTTVSVYETADLADLAAATMTSEKEGEHKVQPFEILTDNHLNENEDNDDDCNLDLDV